MTFKLPPLTTVQLRAIAAGCGLPTTGTKPEISKHIINAVSNIKISSAREPQRILSIDMGIRNLAYSLLTPAAGSKHATVHEWQRRNLVPTNPTQPKHKKDTEAWTRPNMAALTLSLIRDTVIPLKPTHILIEQQRYRTMGAGAVQEWTLRVNTLEAMIYATLATMQSLGAWKGEVMPVPPSRVAGFWVKEVEHDVRMEDGKTTSTKDKRDKRKQAKNKTKLEKIKIVGEWLESEKDLELATQQVNETALAYLDKWRRKRRPQGTTIKRLENESEIFEKLDDLADSLLQGAAWLKWEENKRRLVEQGAEQFLQKLETFGMKRLEV